MAFSFGGWSNGNAGPTTAGSAAASGPSFGLNSNSNNVTTGQQPPPGEQITVPIYNDVLPARSVWYKVTSLLQIITSSPSSSVSALNNEIGDAFKAKQELIHLLQDLESPNGFAQRLLLRNRTNSILEKVSPDNSLRQRLQQRPIVTLSIEQPDGTVIKQEATITPSMLNDICMIADDLMIPEIVAMSLYHQAASSEVPFKSRFVQSILKSTTGTRSISPETASVPWMAREIYFSQSSLILHSCLSLLQNRLRENSDESSLNPVTEATDHLLQSGLIPNLIQIVRDYTQRIDTLLVENSEGRPIPGNFVVSSPPTPNETSAHFWRNQVVLHACYSERQLAVECLYFIAYNTQMQDDEVVALMNLLRDITNNCIIFDPYTDVPDPMEVIPFGSGAGTSTTFNLNSAAPWLTQQPQREKDALAWERELVTTAMQTGQPQLLRCGCTILIAVFSALGNRAMLMDRTTHRPNAVGIGNALFPPSSTSIGGLDKVQKYLNRDSIPTWKRPDVLGLVLASYSMLLQTAQGNSVDTTSDVAQSFQECILVSLELKSFSFARLSLIPALRVHEAIINDYVNDMVDFYCNVTEFFLASVADFASNYMDVFSTLDQPLISRAKWEEKAEADLKAQREQQELEQSLRGNVPKWSDPAVVGSSVIPSHVDLLKRPDCIDDVVAFSTEIGVVGPEYAIQFWSREVITSISEDEEVVSAKLVPSRAAVWLEQQQRNDESLRPVYLSFLSALALAMNPSNRIIGSGADEVFGLVSAECDGGAGWSVLVENFRWYIRQLRPDATSVRAPSVSASSSGGSTAYYYLDQEDTNATDSIFGTNERSKSGEAALQSRPRELGEANEFLLLSNLAILANVAALSASARSTIINIHLPIVEPDGETVGQESVLAILFTLAVMPLSPDVRGSVFHAISTLISVEGLEKEDQENMRLAAIKGWEMLEEFQFLPINLLQQYPSMHDPSYYGVPNMTFPPSSSALAIGKSVQLWIPPDSRYAIIYEMEFVESRRGYYPSTLGFLKLLSSLFSVGGFPVSLGQNWRARTGCTPYIEYVTDYVLPRVTGCFEHTSPLPFRSMQEKSRLTAIALEVVDIVLARYHVVKTKPPSELSPEKSLDFIYKASVVDATHELVLPELVRAVTVRPHEDDTPHILDDYSSSARTATIQEKATDPQSALTNSQVTQPKSPGYSILAGMLSSTRRTLFDSVISPIIDFHKIRANQDTDILSLVYALYVSTPPTITSAKDGARGSWPVNARQLLLSSLRPSSNIKDQTNLLEQEMALVLRILCGVLAKEDTYRYQISLTRQATHIPVLRFTKKSSIPTTVELQPSKLSHMLVSSEMETGVVSSIVHFIGFFSRNTRAATNIAAMATAITFYIERTVHRKQALELFSSRNPRKVNVVLVHAITTRFKLATSTVLTENDAVLLLFICERLLVDLRLNANYGTLTNVVFGEKTATNQQPVSFFPCVDAMLQLLDNIDFVFGESSAEVATLCYEIFYRLIAIGNGNHDVEVALIVAEHLRAHDFWSLSIFKQCSTLVSLSREKIRESKHHVIHSIAWLLKGVACELRILSGISKEYKLSPGLERLVAPHPNLFKQLIDVIFSDKGLVDYALDVLPIERPYFTSIADAPIDEKCVTEAKYSIRGAPEVVFGYDVLDVVTLWNLLKMKHFPVDEVGLHSWVEQWNHSVLTDCSSAHLSDAIRLVIESSLACSYNHGFDYMSVPMVGRTTIFQLISCMSPQEDDMKNIESIDTTYFTTSCRNIASAACMISIAIGEEWKESKYSDDTFDFATLSKLITRTIACSVADNRSYAEYVRIRERIVALAGVLLPILRARPNQFTREDDGRFWYQAAVVLAQLSTNCDTYSQTKRSTSPCKDNFVMQTCLCEILENLNCSGGSYTCRAILTYTSTNSQIPPIRGILDLIKSFDENVELLAQRLISISPEISELFISSGVFEALLHAADVYYLEEKKLLALLANQVNYNASQIQIPTYLQGHFEILSALMTSRVDPILLQESLPKISATLGTYIHLFERIVNRFPIGGDTLYSMLRCITQANLLQIEKSQRKAAFINSKSQSLTSTNASTNFAPFLGPVAKLTIHIAENPLPSRMLDTLPSRLKSPELSFGLVTLAESNSPTWWDTQELGLVDINDICRIAALGMDLIRFGVLLIRHSASPSNLDEFSLSRCLCRCTDAARKIESTLQSSRQGQSIKFVEQATITELTALRSKIIDSLESVLFLTLSYVRTAMNDATRGESCRRIFTFALDHARLDILNLDSSTFNVGDENHPCIISDLSREVRLLLSQHNVL